MFKYPLFILFLRSGLSLFLSYNKYKKNLLTNQTSLISLKDKGVFSICYFLNKFLPEYAILFTDYMCKILSSSCSAISLILLIILLKTPVIGNLLLKICNISDKDKDNIKVNLNDVIKAILTSIAVIFLSYNPESNNKEQLKYALIGYVLVLLGLFFNSIINLKVMANSNKYNKEENDSINEEEKKANQKQSDQLKLEYLISINVGLSLFSLFGVIYYLIFDDLFIFLRYNLLDFNFVFILIVATVSSSFGNKLYVSLLNDLGPMSYFMVSALKKCISLILSIIVFQKSLDYYKTIGLIVAFILIIFETANKKNKKKKMMKIKG